MSARQRMQAAIYRGSRDIGFEEVDVPTAAPGELLIRVGTVGVCGTDVNEWVGGPQQHPFGTPHPVTGHEGAIIPGHEFSGTVVALGDGVGPEWLGREVASCGSVACGSCPPCQRGQSNQCRRYAGVGLHRDGALAEFVTTPVENCLDLAGSGLSLDEAALCQPMSIAVHNVSRSGGVDGQLVVVVGVGGIGTFLVYALVESGAHVLAVDVDPARISLAEEMGAQEILLVSGDAQDAAAVLAQVGERELRVVFEVTGTGGGLATALAVAPKGGRIVVVGVQRAPVEIDLSALTLQEKMLIGTNALVRETDFPRALELVARRAGRWHPVAPRVVPLADYVEEALVPMSEGRPRAVKTLVDPSASRVRPLGSLS